MTSRTVEIKRIGGKVYKITYKRKYSLWAGIKNLFNAFNDYFGLYSFSDKVWYYSIIGLGLVMACYYIPANLILALQ